MKAYLDTDIVSAIAKDDYADETDALDKLLELSSAGNLELVTSELTRREIDAYKGQHRKGVARVYLLLKKVPFVEDHTLLGIHSQWDRYGGVSYPLMEDDPISRDLRQMGLDRTDAHHLMLAIRAGCHVFLTCDENTILRLRPQIQNRFQIRLLKPSELVQELLTSPNPI